MSGARSRKAPPVGPVAASPPDGGVTGETCESATDLRRPVDDAAAGSRGRDPEIRMRKGDGILGCAGGAPPADGLTIHCMEQNNTDTTVRSLTVPAVTENLETVNAFVDEFLEAHDCPMKTMLQVDLVVEEIFVNIASYAYPDKTGDAEIRISAEDGVATIAFLDAGVPYDPLKKADPDITLSAEDRPIGGLGIYLVKKNMDTVAYRYENGRNVLTMTKTIGTPERGDAHA